MTSYRVMVASRAQPGKMTPVGREYLQRHAAFKKAARVAKFNAGRKVAVWEDSGPGQTAMHVVQEGTTR